VISPSSRVICVFSWRMTLRATRWNCHLHIVELIDRREPDVLIYVGCERGSGGDVDIFAVFD
jgi:hypothetical protein